MYYMNKKTVEGRKMPLMTNKNKQVARREELPTDDLLYEGKQKVVLKFVQ